MSNPAEQKGALALSPVEQRLILHWGEMGTRWGINRTVAQIHALLYLAAKPLNAETIAATLAIARSNVSQSLRELQSWELIRVVHQLGDRRDYFETFADVWEMFERVLDGRKRREVDPTLGLLRDCVADLAGEPASEDEAETRRRLRNLLEFFELAEVWYHAIRALPRDQLRGMAKLGPNVADVTGKGDGE